ncbi:MAG: hypothetical protein PVI43_01520 [Candidatus Bathyarchaeota archaeon]|jgi:hypothetical protein
MAADIKPERRAMLGNVSREVFVEAGSKALGGDNDHAATFTYLLYDILNCMDSKNHLNAQNIAKIPKHCGMQMEECDRKFVKKARIGKKILPFSWPPLIVVGGLALVGIGAGWWKYPVIIEIFKFFKLIV